MSLCARVQRRSRLEVTQKKSKSTTVTALLESSTRFKRNKKKIRNWK